MTAAASNRNSGMTAAEPSGLSCVLDIPSVSRDLVMAAAGLSLPLGISSVLDNSVLDTSHSVSRDSVYEQVVPIRFGDVRDIVLQSKNAMLELCNAIGTMINDVQSKLNAMASHMPMEMASHTASQNALFSTLTDVLHKSTFANANALRKLIEYNNLPWVKEVDSLVSRGPQPAQQLAHLHAFVNAMQQSPMHAMQQLQQLPMHAFVNAMQQQQQQPIAIGAGGNVPMTSAARDAKSGSAAPVAAVALPVAHRNGRAVSSPTSPPPLQMEPSAFQQMVVRNAPPMPVSLIAAPVAAPTWRLGQMASYLGAPAHQSAGDSFLACGNGFRHNHSHGQAGGTLAPPPSPSPQLNAATYTGNAIASSTVNSGDGLFRLPPPAYQENQNGRPFHDVPEHLRTPELCLAAVMPGAAASALTPALASAPAAPLPQVVVVAPVLISHQRAAQIDDDSSSESSSDTSSSGSDSCSDSSDSDTDEIRSHNDHPAHRCEPHGEGEHLVL